MILNKKLTIGILLTFIVCIGSAILAAYSTGPFGNYPNPGVHPGMIGPGTFNDSGVANSQWNVPGDLNIYGNIAGSGNLEVKSDITFGDDPLDKVKAYQYCDENGANCVDASTGGGGTAVFYESSGYESGINAHTYCINKGYSHAIMYEYWNGRWGSCECCTSINDLFHNTRIVLETDNPSLRAGQANIQFHTGSVVCYPPVGGAAYYFKIICS